MKPATIKDVAKEAGVSISVVSYVLNNNPNVSISRETRDRVVNAARKLNYTVNSIARGMRTKKSMVICLATFWDISDSVFADVLKGIDSVAEGKGYSVTYCNIRNGLNASKVVDLYKRRQIDGAILFFHVDPASGFDEAGFIKDIKKNGIPAVVINGNTEDPDMNYIYFDYHNTTYSAVNYLYKLGHRDFCYMLPNEQEMQTSQATLRLKGYKDALRDLNLEDHGLYFDRNSIFNIIDLLKPTAGTGAFSMSETVGTDTKGMPAAAGIGSADMPETTGTGESKITETVGTGTEDTSEAFNSVPDNIPNIAPDSIPNSIPNSTCTAMPTAAVTAVSTYSVRPTAIVVNKIQYAVSLLKSLSGNGINVPGDISVIACNDQNFAEFLTPPLTTVRIPIYEIGMRSAEIMLNTLEGDSPNVKLKLPNIVVERESCRGCG